ncbi:MAG: thiol peroxidase [Vicingaceae bacterium]
MSNIKFDGDPINVSGEIPAVGSKAEDFTFVKEDLKEGSLADYEGKVKVIIALPSIETGVCQKEARLFNEKLDGKDGVVGLVVSRDLPLAMKRFCSAEGLDTIVSASDFRYNDFASQYNVEMIEGPFKGLLARVVFVLDKNNIIVYKEEVDDISHEPDYEAAMEAVEKLV